MTGPFYQFGVHGTINAQTPIDIRSRLNQQTQNLSEITELLIQYKQPQESQTHRSRSIYGDTSHRPRSGHGEGYYPNTKPLSNPILHVKRYPIILIS